MNVHPNAINKDLANNALDRFRHRQAPCLFAYGSLSPSLCVCMPISRSVCSSECLFCCVSVLLTISVNATQNEITSLDERIFSEHNDYRDRLGFCRYQTIALVYSKVIITIFLSEINILGSHVQLYRPNGCAHE